MSILHLCNNNTSLVLIHIAWLHQGFFFRILLFVLFFYVKKRGAGMELSAYDSNNRIKGKDDIIGGTKNLNTV